jgi:hypothetical protein
MYRRCAVVVDEKRTREWNGWKTFVRGERNFASRRSLSLDEKRDFKQTICMATDSPC